MPFWQGVVDNNVQGERGKGDRRDDEKKTTTRTMTTTSTAGEERQAAAGGGGEAQSGWIPTWPGGVWGGMDHFLCRNQPS